MFSKKKNILLDDEMHKWWLHSYSLTAGNISLVYIIIVYVEYILFNY